MAVNGIRLKTKFAKLISTLGHPFLTVPVFVFFLLFSHEPVWKATLLSSLIVGGVFIPIALKTYRGVRKGTYTNLDVSDQSERQRWFIAMTILVLVVTIILWATNQERTLRLATTCALMLLLTAQVVNTIVKASMHMAFHTFLSFLILYFSWPIGVLFFLFAPVLAWSRLHLNRHVLKEVVIGMLMGAFFGGAFWIWCQLG